MFHYKLEGLKQNTKYELGLRARNNIGWSLRTEPFYFYTAQGEYLWECTTMQQQTASQTLQGNQECIRQFQPT